MYRKMVVREHDVLGLVEEVTDTAAARHCDDDFLDVNDLVRTTSANFMIMDIHKSNYGYP